MQHGHKRPKSRKKKPKALVVALFALSLVILLASCAASADTEGETSGDAGVVPEVEVAESESSSEPVEHEPADSVPEQTAAEDADAESETDAGVNIAGMVGAYFAPVEHLFGRLRDVYYCESGLVEHFFRGAMISVHDGRIAAIGLDYRNTNPTAFHFDGINGMSVEEDLLPFGEPDRFMELELAERLGGIRAPIFGVGPPEVYVRFLIDSDLNVIRVFYSCIATLRGLGF